MVTFLLSAPSQSLPFRIIIKVLKKGGKKVFFSLLSKALNIYERRKFISSENIPLFPSLNRDRKLGSGKGEGKKGGEERKGMGGEGGGEREREKRGDGEGKWEGEEGKEEGSGLG